MVSQGWIQVFSIGGGGGVGWMITIGHQTDTSNYFKLSYVFPKTWRFRKNEDWLASQGLCGSRISIFFWDPHISVCFYTYPRVLYFLVGCSKGGWHPSGFAPAAFSSFSAQFLSTETKYVDQSRFCKIKFVFLF